ncbi:MAG TPA: SEL1-like repeat protein [Ktedonobacteraceae bacterium]|nr:SEL1-like repeat protein [Ktedonobacteraceae bacterium]
MHSYTLTQALDAIDHGNVAEALHILHLLAFQGDLEAQFVLGEIHALGVIVPFDRETALQWFTLAAKRGEARSIRVLTALSAEAT